MTYQQQQRVSLTSQWFIVPGAEAQVLEAVPHLVRRIHEEEAGTLMYVVHTPWTNGGEGGLQSLPPTVPACLLFVEEYASPEAFRQHLHGKPFTEFVQRHGNLFISSHGGPFSTVTFMQRQDGFIRQPARPA